MYITKNIFKRAKCKLEKNKKTNEKNSIGIKIRQIEENIYEKL